MTDPREARQSLFQDALRQAMEDADQAVRESKGAWIDYYAGKRDAYANALRLAKEYDDDE